MSRLNYMKIMSRLTRHFMPGKIQISHHGNADYKKNLKFRLVREHNVADQTAHMRRLICACVVRLWFMSCFKIK